MKIEHAKNNFYKLIGPLPKGLVEWIKYAVPGTHRFYEDWSWYVHSDYVDEVRSRTKTVENIVDQATDYATLHLQPTAPPQLVAAAFKTLSKIHHPDQGGNEDEFKKITAAYERLQK